MKKTLMTLTIVCAAMVFSLPAYAIELSADETRPVQQYSGNAQIVFDAGEVFEISSDSISQTDNGSAYSGNVVVMFQDVKLEADTLVLLQQEDGTSLLRTEQFLLFQADTE